MLIVEGGHYLIDWGRKEGKSRKGKTSPFGLDDG